MAEVPATVSAVAALINLALKPLKVISKHVMYPFQVSKNVKSLDTETESLTAMKVDTNRTINNIRDINVEPTEQITLWLRKVETIEKEAANIKLKHEQLGRCLWNISPNPWSYYKVSRSAANKQKKVKSLCERRSSIKEIIRQMAPPLKEEMLACSSRSSYLDSALAYIKHDAHSIIGILGMGGVGKTHLLEQINNELSRDAKFSVVIFVTCSKECTEEKVQKEIINKLGKNNSDSTQSKQSIIYNFLKQHNFVILLDDLWGPLDLKRIGIPGPTNMIGTCKGKVLLTTRSTEVCGTMGTSEEIRVDVLNWDDAWSLFEENVTVKVIDSDPQIREIAKEVAKELGGLPLALKTVGRAMSDCRDPSEWVHAIERLKQARLPEVKFPYNDESVFQKLKLSFDNLRNETLKQCFLHCSLWPEDYHIRKEELIELWMGMGLIDEFIAQDVEFLAQQKDYEKMNKIGYNCIRRLEAVCLLETVDDDGAVKMHDVIRDMALWIANNCGLEKNKWVVYNGKFMDLTTINFPIETDGKFMDLKTINFPTETGGIFMDLTTINFPTETEKLSIMHQEFGFNVSFSCTSHSKLSTLLLNSSHFLEIYWLEQFVGLSFIDLSENGLSDFPVVICKLVHLQFLNLSRNSIELLPDDLASLSSLRYLLVRDNLISTMSYRILSNLKALRVLDISGIRSQEYADFPSFLEKTKLLPKFQALGISITGMRQFHLLDEFSVPIRWLQVSVYRTEPSVTFLLGNSQIQNLVSLKIRTGPGIQSVMFERSKRNSLDRSSSHFERLEELEFLMHKDAEVKEIRWNNLSPSIVLKRLRVLVFRSCNSMTCISWIVYLPCLEELNVTACRSIKQLIDDEYMVKYGEESSKCTFPSLKKLQLITLRKMEIICDPKITFPALEIVQIDDCPSLRELPFRANTIPAKLRQINGEKSWWDNIEWTDSNHKSALQPFFREKYQSW